MYKCFGVTIFPSSTSSCDWLEKKRVKEKKIAIQGQGIQVDKLPFFFLYSSFFLKMFSQLWNAAASRISSVAAFNAARPSMMNQGSSILSSR
jgi:hypothetical protein